MRVQVALLDAHFEGPVRTTSFCEAVARSRRSIPDRRRARTLGGRFRGNVGCRRIERSGRPARVCGGAANGVKSGSFGGHGRSFVGCHLTIGSSDRGSRLR
jgi:hypothetical protein